MRVAVHASGVNFAETRMRSGTYIGQQLPFLMGMESAGIVEAVGPGVTQFAVGDRVFGRARGSHATHVLFDEVHTLRMPDGLDFVAAAAIPVGWLTAWHALVTVAQARREVASAREQTVRLSPDEQLAFWQALQVPAKLTPAQKRLGAIMRGVT
jgi:NADPH:quinone reductase-like Zn-dependent oxidoreductase